VDLIFSLILRGFLAISLADFNFTFWYVKVRVSRSPRNVEIAFSHAGLTHYDASYISTNLRECCNCAASLLGIQAWTEKILLRFYKFTG
jgi:hypothetical protein